MSRITYRFSVPLAEVPGNLTSLGLGSNEGYRTVPLHCPSFEGVVNVRSTSLAEVLILPLSF